MIFDIQTFAIFLVGIFSAYFGTFTSGGVSVLGVGLLTLLGIGPQLATITFKFWKIGDTLWWLYLFYKNGHIKSRFLLLGGIMVLCGSFLGSYIIFSISSWIIYAVSALSMLVLVVVSYYKKTGAEPITHISQRRVYMYYFALFCLSFFGNIFIAGSGVWYYFNNTFILRLSALEAKWTATAMTIFWLIGTLSGVILQWQYNLVWWISLALGMLIWGYLGTRHIISLGNDIFRRILLVSIVIFAFYFFYLAYTSF
jgi:uncharacterized membrane protein YfcA